MDASIIAALVTGGFGLVGGGAKYLLDKKKAKSVPETPKLINHPIFSRLEMLKNHIAMSFELQNKGKQEIFKDLLINNIDIWSGVLKELAEELDDLENSSDTTELNIIIMRYFEKGIHGFDNYYRTSRYTLDEQQALDIVMSKFNKWNYPRIQTTHNTFQSICNSPFYADNKVKSAVILDMYVSYFVDIINDAESTLNELNGDLKGLVFRNISI